MSGDDDPWPPEPRANPRLLGQEEAEARLLAAEASGRLPHAWLLAGPRKISMRSISAGSIAPQLASPCVAALTRTPSTKTSVCPRLVPRK